MASSALASRKLVEPESTRLPDPDPYHELAQRLVREFDAPVGLLDPVDRLWRCRIGLNAGDYPDPEDCSLTALGREAWDRTFLWRPQRDGGPTWLGLPVSLGGNPGMVAMIGFASPCATGERDAWGPPCPESALRAWGQAVADRLRAESDSRFAAPPRGGAGTNRGAHLTDSLIRRLRVSDAPERFQRLAVQKIREELGVEAVAWIPASPREPVVVDGQSEGLTPEAYRTLVPEGPAPTVQLSPSATASGRPQRLALVAADKDSPGGWLAAVNPPDALPFSAGEIELLGSIASLIGTQRANARLYADLKDLLFGIIRALTSAIDAKDPYTSGHSERVARIAVRLGEELGLSPNQRGDLYLMGLLHDVGKIGIEDGVLKKPGKLTPEEYRQIQSHVKIGVHILADLKKLHHLLPGVAHHHEAMDGSGYPSGLSGEQIPLAARILAVADAYDAMSSSRPYRRRMTTEQIEKIFLEGSGKQWDPRVVNALFASRSDIERIRSKGLGESLHQVVDDTLGRLGPANRF